MGGGKSAECEWGWFLMANGPVYYYKNDGTNTVEELGASIAPSASTFGWTRDGYTFVNWNTQADGSGDSYEAGVATAGYNLVTELYAQWQAATDQEYIATASELTSVANAIRTKAGLSVTLTFPEDFVSAIANIPTGITPTGTKSITISGSGTITEDVTNYASASITTPSGTEGTPTATKGTVSNHSVSVTPSVTNTTGFITGSTKTGTAVSVSASELVSGTKSISANGTGIDVTNYASVDVAVPTGITPTGTKSITISGAGTITEDVTNYANVSIITPTAQNNPYVTTMSETAGSLTVTPVLNITSEQIGFTDAGVTLGEPITLTASDLVSGTKVITQNGFDDVTNYARVNVNVPTGGGGGSVTTYEADTTEGTIAYGGDIIGIYDPDNGVYSHVQIEVENVGVFDFVCMGGEDSPLFGFIDTAWFAAYDENDQIVYIADFSGSSDYLQLSDVIDFSTQTPLPCGLYSDLSVYSISGGGGVDSVTFTISNGVGKVQYIDAATGAFHSDDFISGTVTATVPKGSMVVQLETSEPKPTPEATHYTNLTSQTTINAGSRSTYPYIRFFIAEP